MVGLRRSSCVYGFAVASAAAASMWSLGGAGISTTEEEPPLIDQRNGAVQALIETRAGRLPGTKGPRVQFGHLPRTSLPLLPGGGGGSDGDSDSERQGKNCLPVLVIIPGNDRVCLAQGGVAEVRPVAFIAQEKEGSRRGDGGGKGGEEDANLLAVLAVWPPMASLAEGTLRVTAHDLEEINAFFDSQVRQSAGNSNASWRAGGWKTVGETYDLIRRCGERFEAAALAGRLEGASLVDLLSELASRGGSRR